MTTGPRAPSARDVLEMASDFGIDMEADEAATQVAMRADEPMDQGDMNGRAPVAPKSPPPA